MWFITDCFVLKSARPTKSLANHARLHLVYPKYNCVGVFRLGRQNYAWRIDCYDGPLCGVFFDNI